jgi:N-acetylmuramoyl-L-alanine amidase
MDILTAAQWGRTLFPGASLVPLEHPATYWVIHHTAGSTSRTLADELRMVNADALEERKTCIDYNFAVTRDGEIGEGRGWGVVGAHTGAEVATGLPREGESYNECAHAIVFIGNYDEIDPTLVQLEAAAWLMAEGVRLGHVVPTFITKGHRDTKPTACPGGRLYPHLDNLHRAALDNLTEENDMPLSKHDLDEIKRIVDELLEDRIGECGTDSRGKPIKRSVVNAIKKWVK